MEIKFGLSHVFFPGSSSLEDSYVLRILLEALVKIDLQYVRSHTVPTLYKSGVRYGRTVIWDSVPDLYAKQFGDCKSLSAARIAELIKAGINARPVFRWRKRNDGGKEFHILVMLEGGVWEDPSRILGMTDYYKFYTKSILEE